MSARLCARSPRAIQFYAYGIHLTTEARRHGEGPRSESRITILLSVSSKVWGKAGTDRQRAEANVCVRKA
jgi:hypothetical protein